MLTILLCISFSAPSSVAASESGLLLVDVVARAAEKSPDVFFAGADVRRSRAVALAVQAPFDVVVGSDAGVTRTLNPLVHDTVDDASLGVSATKLFTLGTEVTAGVSTSRTLNTAAAAQVPPLSTSANALRGELSITQHILRNDRGDSRTWDAATTNIAAAELALDHARAAAVLDAVLAFWRYRSAAAGHEVLRAAEDRARALVTDTEVLVRADEVPAADLVQLQAIVAQRTRGRLDGERTLREARDLVVLAIGGDSSAPQVVALPADDIPAIPDGTFVVDVETLTNDAPARRRDVQSLERQAQANKLLLSSNDFHQLPTLDASVNVAYLASQPGYQAIDFAGAAFAPLPGFSASVDLLFELPIENSAARARLGQTDVARELVEITRADLLRRVNTDVRRRATDLQTHRDGLISARTARALFDSAVENERRKLNAGLSTVIDVVTTEDRLTGALLDEIAAENRWAAGVAELCFVSGCLSDALAKAPGVAAAELTRIPAGSAG